MKLETAKRIIQVWNDIEEDDPDISTERLFQMTADVAKVPYGDVTTALMIMDKESRKKKS